MDKKKNVFLLFSLAFFLTLLLLLSNKPRGNLAGLSTTRSVDVSLSIGDHRFTLFGYTSPYALVTFSGLGIFDQTRADSTGYFIFNNRFSPFSPKEACLNAQDQMGRLTSEVCLPSFPTNYNVEIGPVIMPPTLSLNKENYWVGDEVILTGQGVPNSQVNLSFFTEKTPLSIFNNLLVQFLPIKKAFALSLPPLSTKVDEKGNFAIALSSSAVKKYRLFTQVIFKEKNSPKSRKLTIEILPWWIIAFKIMGAVIFLIRSHLLELIILTEIIALFIYFYHSYLHPKQLAIVKWEKKAIVALNEKY